MLQSDKSNTTNAIILASAGALFAQNGYEATTMQDITQNAQLSKGAAYHHFKSKQEILDRLIENQVAYVNDGIRNLVNNPQLTAKEKMQKITDLFCENELQHTLLQTQWIEKNPCALLMTIRNTMTTVSGFIADIIRQGIKEKEFDCLYPDEVAGALCLLLDLWVDPAISSLSAEQFCRRIDFIKDFLSRYGVAFPDEQCVDKIKKSFNLNNNKEQEKNDEADE